jgi:CMP-N,N'-diacetyllegionaminic acid synthase
MKILFLIPARAGSKGLPGKNTKILGNKPLIEYSIDFAIENMGKNDELCISTNDSRVIEVAKKKGIKIPFIRPEELSTDTSGSNEVILHALDFYKANGKLFDCVLLLQPTSPFRIKEDFENLMALYDDTIDMVVSVKITHENPYFNLFEENEFGFLNKSKIGTFVRRQDCPLVYAFNGSFYLINVKSMQTNHLHQFLKIKKMLMPAERSVDIDNQTDWLLVEHYLDKYENS